MYKQIKIKEIYNKYHTIGLCIAYKKELIKVEYFLCN